MIGHLDANIQQVVEHKARVLRGQVKDTENCLCDCPQLIKYLELCILLTPNNIITVYLENQKTRQVNKAKSLQYFLALKFQKSFNKHLLTAYCMWNTLPHSLV